MKSYTIVRIIGVLMIFCACESSKKPDESGKTYFKVYDFSKIDRMRYVFSLSSGSLGLIELSDSLSGLATGQNALRFDKTGDTVWTRKIGGINWRKEADGKIRGLIYGESDYFVFVSPDGSVSGFSIKKRGASVYNDAHTPALDGGYTLVGSRWVSVSKYSSIISCVNSLGDTIWTTEFAPFQQNYYPFFKEIIRTKDSGYVALGGINYATSPVGDLLVIKVNSAGELMWSDTLRTHSDNYDAQIVELTSGELLIATTPYLTSNALYRLSADGDSLSAISFSYFGNGFSRMAQSSNGEIGLVYIDGFKVLDNNLSEKFTHTWLEVSVANLRGCWIDATSQGWIIGGNVSYGRDSSDAFILSVSEDGVLEP